MKSLASVILCLAVTVCLSGCNEMTVNGKVFAGDLGRVIRVSETDPRLDEAGLGGVDVSLLQGGNQSRATAVLAKGVSEPDGSFSLSISSENLRAGRILVIAESESVFKVQNLVEYPLAGESLLVQVIERKASSESAPEDDPE